MKTTEERIAKLLKRRQDRGRQIKHAEAYLHDLKADKEAINVMLQWMRKQ